MRHPHRTLGWTPWLLLAPLALAACGSDVEHRGGSGGSTSTSSTEHGSTGIFAGSDCTAVCERSLACQNGPETDCAKACADAEAEAAAIGCSSEFDAFVDCYGTVEDLCTMNSTSCQSEVSAYLQCTQSFCDKQPSDPSCTGSGGAEG